jgi:acyl-CoA reductase-like NAD-dependent aldehyde dehydrogenase
MSRTRWLKVEILFSLIVNKAAVRDGIRNVMSNSGQSCDAPTRMLVEKINL